MKKVIISAIDKSNFVPKIVYIELLALENLSKKDVLDAIESSCKEYYYSNQNTSGVKDYSDFNYDDFKKYVPNDICEYFGISKIQDEVLTIEIEDPVLFNMPNCVEYDLEEEYYNEN